jgi:hypothetical protein
MNHYRILFFSLLLANSATSLLHATQPLETETARLIPQGVFQLEYTMEYQTSSEGKETAVPLVLKYGLSNRLELLVEPVVYTAIKPNQGKHATGVGDMEATVTYLLKKETSSAPALAIAGEIKIPTAQDVLIGTGKTDYTAYMIASKRLGKSDLHGNASYTVLGDPAGIQLHNIFGFAAAEEYHLNKKIDLVGEFLATTSALAEGTEGESTVVPEAAGSEVVGMIGARYYFKNILISFGVTYDNNKAVLFRPGFSVKF